MCGISAYFDKSGALAPIGATLLDMLGALGRRGPDSAGLAVWGEAVDGLVVRVALAGRPDVAALEADPGVEVVSLGQRLEIVKNVGPPRNLDAAFAASTLMGTHGIGHTRLSTESRVDLSHSQPFWAHGVPDLAVVHNGHITSYHRLRRIYEQDGVRFYTDNDSEVIGVYLARKLREGASLREALLASVRELDGSFSYLAATADAIGFAKDPYCLKPLLVAETERAVAIANEEIALHAVLGSGYRAREAGSGEVVTWEIPR